ncbi:uncharacterized protein LTR77_006328 [Saxophila tyrrhenica]|uniref:DUF7702 domain-containing protein n=1 Tax=Saxophila tyrrhenica TaxID=1690608 RepID=A0AAV9P7L3_9PEZI|nr:hypothetical protein LTR77_006328 [Saxophila tyrrhenica]
MSPLQPKGGLAAAQVAFFAPALLISTYIVFRHGLRRQLGWLYLVLLSILRLVGASATLWSETQNDYSKSILQTAFITSAVGTAPLLLVLLGFMQLVNKDMKTAGSAVGIWVFRGIHLLSLAALVLAILGGTDISSTISSTVSLGHTLLKAGSIVFLVIYLALAAITFLTFSRKYAVLTEERKLVDAGLAALPFLLVRIIYTVVVSFAGKGSIFYLWNVNVYVSAFMQFLMEAFVVVIFMTAGLLTPKRAKTVGQRGPEYASVGSEYDMENGGHQMGPQRVRQHEQQNIGGYRPSRLIRNAMRGS